MGVFNWFFSALQRVLHNGETNHDTQNNSNSKSEHNDASPPNDNGKKSGKYVRNGYKYGSKNGYRRKSSSPTDIKVLENKLDDLRLMEDPRMPRWLSELQADLKGQFSITVKNSQPGITKEVSPHRYLIELLKSEIVV